MTRDELLAPIVKYIRQGTTLAGPDILRFFEDWEVIPGYVDGQHVMTAVLKGTEIHVALVPGWRPKTSHRGAIRAFTKPLLERIGFLTTRVMHERLAQKKFVQRMGFKSTWKDDNVEYYLLGHLPFERNK